MKYKLLALLLFLFSASGWLFLSAKATTGGTPIEVSAPQEAIPPNITGSTNKPMMMLASSKDHTLFSPIYTDYEDIDGDGILDTDFKPTYKYYGYFDSSKCYLYSLSDGRFNPHSAAVVKTGRMTCSSSAKLWSGNFLNWATMSRLDVIRKMLYGGKRSTDGVVGSSGAASVTVLERANLSQDSHSFVKVYFGQDIRDYTPFTPSDLVRNEGENAGKYAGLTICSRSDEQSSRGNPVIRLAKGNQKMWALVQGRVCSWLDERYQWFDEKAPSYFIDPDKGNGLIRHEREAPYKNNAGVVYDGIGPDLTMRVRVCDPALLGEERCQPYPVTSATNYKPYGIFQEFGTTAFQSASVRAEFGLFMGSYDRNLTAGVLRKNIEDFGNEIHPDTGVFCHSPSSGCSTALNGANFGQGAIKSFDNIQLVGREGATDALEPQDGIDTDYRGNADTTPTEMRDGNLPAWGNPLGEIVTQALRYFAGGSSTNPTDTSTDNRYGMPVSVWQDPFRADSVRASKYGPPACRPMYVMALSSSALSFDESSGPIFSELPNRTESLNQYVDWIGVNEKVTGDVHGWRSVGATDGSFGQDCTLKKLGKLSDATGVCPEYGAFKGTWQISGASLYANTSKIRTTESLRLQNQLPSDIDAVEDALKVKTLSASLQGGVPRIEVAIPNSNPQKYVYITPESMWEGDGKLFPGAILSFQSINAGERYGSFLVSWNDRAFGGDYDMDMTGFLRYDVVDDGVGGYDLKITTDVLQVTSGMTGTHGYSVIGSDRDGRYLTHTHGHIATVLRNVSGNQCKDMHFTEADRDLHAVNRGKDGKPDRCNVSWASFDVFNKDLRHTETFKMRGADDVTIQDPLWYAAKYGFVKSSKQNANGTYTDMSVSELLQEVATHTDSWDKLKSDGTAGTDGVPDGYVLARRPELLENQLRKTLEMLATTANTAVALSNTVLASGAYKYTVQFDNHSVTGKLQAHTLNAAGNFAADAAWEAGSLLKARTAKDQGESRQIITNDGTRGAPFRWDSLSADWKTQLTTASTNPLSSAHAQATLNYIRGDQRAEGNRGLRERMDTLLGPVVNSTPWIQQRPSANWGGQLDGYGSFYEHHRQRSNVLWLGANDGMLHAFNATTGAELMAYVPGALTNRLAEIPLQRNAVTRLNGANFVSGAEARPMGTIWPYVDGNPFSADVKVGDNWYTYAFGSLGRGGRGIFALDATDVQQLTENRAAQIFKWQFTAADDLDMGYQVGDVKLHPASNQASSIARLNNGKFAWILGNGPLSRTGKAALFILYVDGPASNGSWSGRYQKIVVDAGTGNGLSAPRWEDLDGDGTADVVYAGDLKGNVWKFDLRSDDPSQWAPAFSAEATAVQPATPLFTATRTEGNRSWAQPITTAPELVYMGLGGLMVNVGTGNAFRQGDFGASTTPHSVYGVWDRGAALPTPRLLVRQYTRLSDGSVVANEAATPNPSSANNYDGWRIDLPMDGEAVLTDPAYEAGILTFVSTRPNSGTALCNTAPRNSLYMLDPISGKPERVTQGYVTVDGVQIMVAAKDIQDPKVRVVSDRRPPPQTSCQPGTPGCSCTGSDCAKDAPRCGPGQRTLSAQGRSTEAAICYSTAPRLQWREIPGLRTYPD